MSVPKRFLFVIITIISLFYVKNEDDCFSSLKASISSLNFNEPSKIDFSNPALSSGTNLNDLGKYDACLKNVSMTYILINFPYPFESDDIKNASFNIFIGICAPKKQCENDITYKNIAPSELF